jgi:hypothetical protein
MTRSTVDHQTVRAAERLLGIQYTDAERVQMLDNLTDQLELAVRRRAMKLPNSLAPATVFDPRLPGFAMPAQSRMNVPRVPAPLPTNDEDIAFAPIGQQAAWIAGGQVTSVRLTRMYLDRIRRHDPALLSFATVTEALALAGCWLRGLGLALCTASRTLPRTSWTPLGSPLDGVPSHSQTAFPRLMLK